MSRILVSGLCPLPFENTPKSFGPGIRTWQFAAALAADGHEVLVRALQIGGVYSAACPPVATEIHEGVRIERLEHQEFFDRLAVRRWLADQAPDAVVGATVYGSQVLASAEPEHPFWADQFGHFMAEAQAKANLDGSDLPIRLFWERLEPILERADHFSAVSTPQKWAQVGELGACGRLTAATTGYDFVSVVPCALVPRDPSPAPPELLVRGPLVPKEAFVVLWSGGYNVWSDVDTLFEGLETAMDENPRIHFVSTGGEIGGHDDSTYSRFLRKIRGSRLRDRFHLLGWLPAADARRVQDEADVGVIAERPIYEGALGSKNRILQWMGAGLLVVYNRHGEIAEVLERQDLGRLFPCGSPSDLRNQLLAAGDRPASDRERVRRAREFATRELSFAATTKPLREWCLRPTFAPDRRSARSRTGPPRMGPRPTERIVAQSGWDLQAPGFPRC